MRPVISQESSLYRLQADWLQVRASILSRAGMSLVTSLAKSILQLLFESKLHCIYVVELATAEAAVCRMAAVPWLLL